MKKVRMAITTESLSQMHMNMVVSCMTMAAPHIESYAQFKEVMDEMIGVADDVVGYYYGTMLARAENEEELN